MTSHQLESSPASQMAEEQQSPPPQMAEEQQSPPPQMAEEQQSPPPLFDEASLSKAKLLARLLRASSTYRRLLHEDVERQLAQVDDAFRDQESEIVARAAAKNAVIGINAYQVWEKVLSDIDTVDTVYSYLLSVVLLSCAGSAGYYYYNYSDNFSWIRVGAALVYLVIAVVCAVLTLLILLLISEAKFPRSRKWRNACAILLFAIVGYGLFRLSHWETLWGQAMYAGAGLALAALFIMAVLLQVARATLGVMWRYTWSEFTAEEIIQSLAVALTYVDEAEATYKDSTAFPSAVWYQAKVARTLDHVAFCMERYLPRTLLLDDEPALREVVLPQLLGVAACVRKLAHQALLRLPDAPIGAGPEVSTRNSVKIDISNSVKTEISKLLVSSARGEWGSWGLNAARLAGEPKVNFSDAPNRRFWLNSLGAVLLKLVPLIVVAAGLVLLYQKDPKSNLLAPEIVGPLAAAAFAYLTTMIVSSFQHNDQEHADPTRPKGGLTKRFGN
jgi:hypothetical protein